MNNLHNIHELSSMIDISLEEALGAIEGRYEETEFHLKRDFFFLFTSRFTTATTNRGKQLIGVNSVSNDVKHNWIWTVLRVPNGSQTAQIITTGLDETAVKSQDRIVFRFGRI